MCPRCPNASDLDMAIWPLKICCTWVPTQLSLCQTKVSRWIAGSRRILQYRRSSSIMNTPQTLTLPRTATALMHPLSSKSQRAAQCWTRVGLNTMARTKASQPCPIKRRPPSKISCQAEIPTSTWQGIPPTRPISWSIRSQWPPQ